MSCYKPIQGFQSPNTGKLTKQYRPGWAYLEVPCGYCIGCRLDRSRSWAIRCMHESQMHENNSFVTLTYDQDNLPNHASLNPKHFQLFIKNLRKRVAPKKVRYFQCGEYGEQLQRPHHHACLFGHDFSDKYLWTERNGNQCFRSKTLEELWPYGQSEIGDVTWSSAAYTARYIMKKITGSAAREHYETIDPDTGEIIQFKLPEYVTMSRRPGIGKSWFQKYWTDVYPSDQVIVDGKPHKPPKYYDGLMEEIDPALIEHVRALREQFADDHQEDNTPKRLREREFVKQAQTEFLKRNLEG